MVFCHLQVFLQLDCATGELDADQTTTQEVTLHMFGQPFARGSYRNVYWAVADGEQHVVKRYIGQTSPVPVHVVEQVF